MFVNDTQRRRPAEKSDDSQKGQNVNNSDSEKSKSKSKMPAWIRFSPANVKKILLVLVAFYVAFKVYQLLTYSTQPEVVPPDPRREAVTWTYKHNPQGIDKDGLNDLLDHISRGKYVGVSTKKSKDENAPKKHSELSRVKKPYKSEGSLTFKKQEFYLDKKPFRIYSGAMHYFRVLPQYWEDRMKKMIAGGLNTLETYVAWNMHEDTPGTFNFEGILDIRKYIKLAHKLGLKVILRPGPYICSEWDFGGLPAWLLKDPNMKVRSNYHGYTEAVDRFFGKLISLVTDLQYSNGGPIIAVQIENEFGSYSSEVEHLMYLKKLLMKLGIKEMFFTSDGNTGSDGITGFHNAPFYDEALPMANFKIFEKGQRLLKMIESISEDFPLVVMEFWSGWFDHWQQPHSQSSVQVMASDLQHILNTGASVNMYMYHGGTNFGFMAGANWFNHSTYKPDVTSYDYIAPLSEAGDITPKYEVCRELILKVSGATNIPDPPHNSFKSDYGKVDISHYLPLEDMLTPIRAQTYDHPVMMEMLKHNNGSGQNYGFILYRTHPGRAKKLKFTKPIRDRAQVIVNGIQIGSFDWFDRKWEVNIPNSKLADSNILDILVENNGRVNFVLKGFNRLNEERKGITGEVLLDDEPLKEWKIYPLEFKPSYIKRIMESKKWKLFANWVGITALYSGTLTINGTPQDTFINMKGWNKGCVFINGFNIGRYWKEGPQKTLYVPAPILKVGKNQIVIFELHKGFHSVTFQNTHVLG